MGWLKWVGVGENGGKQVEMGLVEMGGNGVEIGIEIGVSGEGDRAQEILGEMSVKSF